jgi:feruloyl esterase
MVVAFNRIAPRDASGKPIARQAFSDSDRKAVVDGLLRACDANDGLTDGMIFDTRGCAFDPATLVCKGPKVDGCLSHEQVAAIVKAFAGPKDSRGNQVYPGFFYDTGIAASGAGIPGILLGAGPPVPPAPGLDQDVDREARIADTDPQAILTDTASWTNLNTFAAHGGKLIFFHGVSDPWFSAQETIRYYEAVGQAAGGSDREQTWARLFLSPGMGHCGGGSGALDRFDLLTAVVEWVEHGTAPVAVTATGRAFPGRGRPLCAYPQYAHYKGQGDPEDARNFQCRN